MALRILLLGILLWLVWRWWHRARARHTTTRPRAPQVQNMVRCARCGLHVPEREALRDGDRYYCSERCRRSG